MWTNLCQYQDDRVPRSEPSIPVPGEYVVIAEWFDEDGYPRYVEVDLVTKWQPVESIKGCNISLWGADPIRNT